MRPIVGDRVGDLLNGYHEFERVVESEKPHRSYKDVLVTSLMPAARKTGIPLTEEQARELPQNWGKLPVFADVEQMLAGLRAMNCRLGVLTNCDKDLFTQTERNFRKPFDLVVTAEEVGDYKPSHTHFKHFAEITGVESTNWIHVACSWFHDINPARQLGIKRIWLDRDGTGEDPGTASARLCSASEVCQTASHLFEARNF